MTSILDPSRLPDVPQREAKYRITVDLPYDYYRELVLRAAKRGATKTRYAALVLQHAMAAPEEF